MPTGRLAVDKAVCLDGCFFGLSLALDRYPAREAPLCGASVWTLAAWIFIENVAEYLLEMLVSFKLVLDYAEDFHGQCLARANNGDGYLGIADELLNCAADCDNACFAME